MNATDKNRERVLEFIFTILLFLSLVCFAGIPALSQGNSDSISIPEITSH